MIYKPQKQIGPPRAGAIRQRWAFATSEMPAECKADDELIARVYTGHDPEENQLTDPVDVIVYRKGEVSNRFADGTSGVDAELHELADEEDSLYHPARDEETEHWAEVWTNENGDFLGFV